MDGLFVHHHNAAGGSDAEEIYDENLIRAFTSLDCKDLLTQNYQRNRRWSPNCNVGMKVRPSPTPSIGNARRSSPHNPGFIKPDQRKPTNSSAIQCVDGSDSVGLNNEHGSIPCSVFRPTTPMSVGNFDANNDFSGSSKRLSPVLRTKVLANRDKESLMDEIISLKKVLLSQSVSLQRHKVHASNLEAENRKLEKELEETELQTMLKGSYTKTGNPSNFRAKVQGLKAMVSQLEATCAAQQDELQALRQNSRVTRTREIEAERDMLVEEIERLQSSVKQLTVLQNRLICENKQLLRYKDRTIQLEAANVRLEHSIGEMKRLEAQGEPKTRLGTQSDVSNGSQSMPQSQSQFVRGPSVSKELSGHSQDGDEGRLPSSRHSDALQMETQLDNEERSMSTTNSSVKSIVSSPKNERDDMKNFSRISTPSSRSATAINVSGKSNDDITLAHSIQRRQEEPVDACKEAQEVLNDSLPLPLKSNLVVVPKLNLNQVGESIRSTISEESNVYASASTSANLIMGG